VINTSGARAPRGGGVIVPADRSASANTLQL
jgi:hypothetical protein